MRGKAASGAQTSRLADRAENRRQRRTKKKTEGHSTTQGTAILEDPLGHEGKAVERLHEELPGVLRRPRRSARPRGGSHRTVPRTPEAVPECIGAPSLFSHISSYFPPQTVSRKGSSTQTAPNQISATPAKYSRNLETQLALSHSDDLYCPF